jgi:CYTH domain-containing protein
VHLAWLETRQLDVTIAEAPGVERLREELEGRVKEGYGEAVSRAPRKFRKLDRRLRRRLGELETAARASGLSEGVRFATAVERCLPDYAAQLDVYLSHVHTPADEAEAHRARIRAKRLRYLLEPIADDVDGVEDLLRSLKNLQDLLGDLRDAQLLSSLVAELDGRVTDGAPVETGSGLRKVAGWLEAEQRELFMRLRESWLGDRSAAFFSAVEKVRESLVTHGAAEVEIERKYLLSELPPALAGRPYREIEQGYIPGERLRERVRRVRRDGEEWYVRTVKVGSGIRRIELQEDTDRQTFEVLWPLTWGRRVIKRRYRMPEGGLVWEVDEFTDRDLVLAEVELPSEDVQPRLPDWIAPYVVREVTDESVYLNINLAR